VQSAPFSAVNSPDAGDEWVSGRFGMTKDAEELRRWDEQNN
jgi:hypothetical protein